MVHSHTPRISRCSLPFVKRSVIPIFIGLLCFLPFALCSQSDVRGRTIDSLTKEPLAFVAVMISGSQQGTYSDIDGYFELSILNYQLSIINLEFHYLGYQTLVFEYPGEEYWVVQMVQSSETLPEVVIRPGENPAERIIRLAIENKTRNNPESEHSFTYDSYNKLILTAALDSALFVDEAKYNSLDSNQQRNVDFFRTSHIGLMESISQRKYMPPGRSEETVIATRVSGLQDPTFALLGTQLQSFSFYGETVDILGVAYLSPLANGSISKYLFIIEDTTFAGTDTVFAISYRPRKGKNFEGMKGQLFINTNGYALQNVLAEPSEVTGTSVVIQQQYEKINDVQWFPVQLNSFITFLTAQVNGFGLVGIFRSYLKNIELDVDMKAREFTPVTLQLKRLAAKQPDSLWNKYRDRPLDDKELRTYHIVDSVGKAENFDLNLKLLSAVLNGQIPWGVVNFDILRLMNVNGWEGLRLGLGAHTSDQLSPYWNVGGYYAYGFRDKGHKYGTDLKVHINRKRNAWLRLLYEYDVSETGGNQLEKSSLVLNPTNYYGLFINRMDKYEKMGLEINTRALRNITTTFFGYTRITHTFDNYRFSTTSAEGVELFSNQFNTTETGVTVRYAPGEKLARAGMKEVRLGGRFPILWLRYTKGLDNVLNGELDFNRIDALIEKTFKIKNTGDLTLRAYGGMVEENVPLSWQYNARGTWSVFAIATPFAFETMRTSEFQHSHFAALHVRHSFRDLLIKTEKFRPIISAVHSMMVGEMKNEQSHNMEINAATKGYFESGMQVDRLTKLFITHIGIGVFYRYGPYHLENTLDNFAFKFSISLPL